MFDWKDCLSIVLLAGLSLVLYIRTLIPELLPGDGGEFQALAFVVDHAHTTGYSVYTLLAKVFTVLVPIQTIAYRVNLFSAFCAAGTVGMVYLSGRVLSRSRLGGAVAALALAVSSTFWSQAIIAEVYSAGSLFTSAILFFVLVWYETGKGRFLFIAGLLGGLSIGVHDTNLLFAPAILLLVLLGRSERPFREIKSLWKPAVCGAIIGLALFLAAFLAIDQRNTAASIFNVSYRPSAAAWLDHPEELNTTVGRLKFLIFAQQWRGAMFSDPGEIMLRNLGTFVETGISDLSPLVWILGGIGFVSLWRRRRKLGLFFLAGLGVHALYTLNYNIGDIYVFFISFYVYFCPGIAEGSAVVMRFFEQKIPRFRSAVGPVLAVLLLIGTAGPYAAQRIEGLREGEIRFRVMALESNQQLSRQHERITAAVQNLAPNSVVLMSWPDLYRFIYVAQVEQNRPDLQFIEAEPFSHRSGRATLYATLKQYLDAGRPVFSMDYPIDGLEAGGLTSSRAYSSEHGGPQGGRQMFSIQIQ
jgi:hypothetical protein